METPKQRKEQLWTEFQAKSGLQKPSRGLRAVLWVFALIALGLVIASLFR